MTTPISFIERLVLFLDHCLLMVPLCVKVMALILVFKCNLAISSYSLAFISPRKRALVALLSSCSCFHVCAFVYVPMLLYCVPWVGL